MVLKVKASDTRARGRGSTGQVVHTSSVTIWYWPKASAPAGKDSLSPGYESPAGLSLPRDRDQPRRQPSYRVWDYLYIPESTVKNGLL